MCAFLEIFIHIPIIFLYLAFINIFVQFLKLVSQSTIYKYIKHRTPAINWLCSVFYTLVQIIYLFSLVVVVV